MGYSYMLIKNLFLYITLLLLLQNFAKYQPFQLEMINLMNRFTMIVFLMLDMLFENLLPLISLHQIDMYQKDHLHEHLYHKQDL